MIWNRDKIIIGEALSFKEYKKFKACKAIYLGFSTHPIRKYRVAVNYNCHVDSPALDDEWDFREVPGSVLLDYWDLHEERVRSHARFEENQNDYVNDIKTHTENMKVLLDSLGIKYRYTLNEFTFSTSTLEKLLTPKETPNPKFH